MPSSNSTSKTKSMYEVRRLHLESTPQRDALARAAGELDTRTVITFWRTVRKPYRWFNASSMMCWHASNQLHAHSADAVVPRFYAALQSWCKRRKTDPHAKPLGRRCRYDRVPWNASALRARDGHLVLSNGQGTAPRIVPWSWGTPARVERGWTGSAYELRCVDRVEATVPEPVGDETAGIDLGEVHCSVVHDGRQTTIFHGRAVRIKRQYQNEVKAVLANRPSRRKKGSRSWRKLRRSKRKQLRPFDHQHASGVRMVVIGDVRDLRQRVDYGPVANQWMHQMVAEKVRWLVTHKAERLAGSVSTRMVSARSISGASTGA